MTADAPSLTEEMRAVLDWWRLAGVDNAFTNDATDWLGANVAPDMQGGAGNAGVAVDGRGRLARKESGATEDAHEQNDVQRVDLLGPTPPSDLTEFQRWWLSDPGLDAIGPRGRVAPRGPQNAELMVLVIDPEQSDKDTLLSGPHGRLLSRIIGAMGLKDESIYFASALPRHTPMADTTTLSASGMDEVVKLHVNLVSPRKLLAFGAGIPPLLGHALTNDLSHLREINRKQSSIPLLVSEGLDAMMAMPRLKSRFWRRWIEWLAKE